MKTKLQATIFVLGFYIATNAQNLANFEDYYLPKHKGMEASPSEKAKIKAAHKNMHQSLQAAKTSSAAVGAYHQTLSHTDAVFFKNDGANGFFNNDTYVDLVFQDSVPLYSTTGKTPNVYTMKSGEIFDPKSINHFSAALNPNYVTEDLNLTKWDPYTLDTVRIGGFYEKVGTSTIADTLQLEVFWGNPTNTGIFGGLSWNFLPAGNGVTSFKFASSTSHGNTCFISAPSTSKLLIKIPLTISDTGNLYKIIPIGQAIPANNVVGVVYTFVPGYSYTGSDVLFKFTGGTTNATVSSFRTVLYQDPSASNQTPDALFYDDNSDGGTQNLYNDGRYGKYTGSASFLNSLGLSQVLWGYDILFTISANVTGINKLQLNGLKLNDNYPNPFSDNSVIGYDIAENANVSLTVYDITGKKVMYINEGRQLTGKHVIPINAEKLNAGIYFYTLTAGDNSLTKRMTVTK